MDRRVIIAHNSAVLKAAIETGRSGEIIQLLPDFVYEGDFTIPKDLLQFTIRGSRVEDFMEIERYTIKGSFAIEDVSFCSLIGFKLLGNNSGVGIKIVKGCHNAIENIYFNGWKTAVDINGVFNRMGRCKVVDCAKGVVLHWDKNQLRKNQFTTTETTVEINGNNNLVENADFKEVNEGMTVTGNGNTVTGVTVHTTKRRVDVNDTPRCVGIRVLQGRGNEIEGLVRAEEIVERNMYEIIMHGRETANGTGITNCKKVKTLIL